MKIATFNINGITKRIAVLQEWLATESPDVVCLQELKASDTQFPAAALKAAGYHAVWHGQALWHGVAILAKTPPVLVRRGLPGDDAEHAGQTSSPTWD